MSASLKTYGDSDYGHIAAVCSDHKWQSPWYPRRTVEGHRLAERDRDAHNRTHHAQPDPLPTPEEIRDSEDIVVAH